MTEIPKTPQSDKEGFSWREDKDCIVVQHQPAIAVHVNPEDIWGDGRDQIVYFAPEHAEKIIEAIRQAADGVQQPTTNLAKVGNSK